ncbi:MAG: 2-hydroxyacid dehydrogenase [Bacteroidota bacterium]
MKVAVFSTQPYDKEYFERFKPKALEFAYFKTGLHAQTANLSEGYQAVCVFVNDQIDRRTIRRMQHYGVQLIALRCAGFNNVDLTAAEEAGIKVVRVPAYSPEAIAEHTLALILTLNRKTHKAYNRVREGNFSLNRLIGFNLSGKTVGVIGTGKIGQAFCQLLTGFGCSILAYDPYPNEAVTQLGASYTSLQELFAQSDLISLHCPLTDNTRHIINAEAIGQMKKGVMLINTSRGALIDTADVIEGLTQEKIGYLGIDVYEQEENLFFQDLSESIIQDDYILRLNSFPNVLITAHQAYFTKEAMEQITATTIENILNFTEGKILKNQVKPQAMK